MSERRALFETHVLGPHVQGSIHHLGRKFLCGGLCLGVPPEAEFVKIEIPSADQRVKAVFHASRYFLRLRANTWAS